MVENRWKYLGVVVMVGAATSAHADGMIKNGLSDESFKQNAILLNQSAIDTLAHHTIGDALADPSFATQLHDPNALAVMRELVSCALPATSSYTWHDPLDANVSATFVGEMGMCVGETTGDWQGARPTRRCRQLTTGCMLARVNVMQKSVPLSIRPQTIAAPPTRLVATETRYLEQYTVVDPASGGLVMSFQDTQIVGSIGDAGFRPAYAGTCTKGTEVYLQMTDPSRCDTQTVRVCDGIEGCVSPTSSWAVPAGDDVSTQILQTAHTCTPFHFTCPDNGRYSVMVLMALFGSHHVDPVPAFVKTSGTGSYPATEKQVFNTREGAFWGDLFVATDDPYFNDVPPPLWTCSVTAELAARVKPTTRAAFSGAYQQNPFCTTATRQLPYRRAFACYSANMDNGAGDASGAAYASSRMCAAPNTDCFTTTPLRCWDGDPTTSICNWDPDRGVFHDCKDPNGHGIVFPYAAVTTYVNVPCQGLVGTGGTCVGGVSHRIAVHDRDDDGDADDHDVEAPALDNTGGCAATTTSGSATILLGLAFVLRRRRRRTA